MQREIPTEEAAGLLYIDGPVMLSEILTKIIAYTPEAMQRGSMCCWMLPLAPGVPAALIVGSKRAFLTWFYNGATFNPDSIAPDSVGVYRAAFTRIEQTPPLTQTKVRVPIVTIGGAKGLGTQVSEMVALVAENAEGSVLADSGHFVPEERLDEIIRQVLALTAKISA